MTASIVREKIYQARYQGEDEFNKRKAHIYKKNVAKKCNEVVKWLGTLGRILAVTAFKPL